MPSLTKFKGGFFDRLAVVKAMDAAKRKALSKGGAFVRQSAKSSLRYRDKPSAPGQPPSVHRGSTIKGRQASVLKEFIFFAWDVQSQSIVIGPAATNQVFFDRHRQPVTGTVPGVLERGGSITILEVQRRGKWMRADLRSRRRIAELPKRYRTVTIAPRPFMTPALMKELKNLVGPFRSSMTATGSLQKIA